MSRRVVFVTIHAHESCAAFDKAGPHAVGRAVNCPACLRSQAEHARRIDQAALAGWRVAVAVVALLLAAAIAWAAKGSP